MTGTVQDCVCHTAPSVKKSEKHVAKRATQIPPGTWAALQPHWFALLLMNQPLLLRYLPSLFTWKPSA